MRELEHSILGQKKSIICEDLDWSEGRSDTEANNDLSEDAELNPSDVTSICFDKKFGVPGFVGNRDK